MDRRRRVHFAVTANPTAEWTARQLLEAFPRDNAPWYLLRDRDDAYGEEFRETAKWIDTREVLTAPESIWQNAYVERLIGSSVLVNDVPYRLPEEEDLDTSNATTRSLSAFVKSRRPVQSTDCRMLLSCPSSKPWLNINQEL